MGDGEGMLDIPPYLGGFKISLFLGRCKNVLMGFLKKKEGKERESSVSGYISGMDVLSPFLLLFLLINYLLFFLFNVNFLIILIILVKYICILL
jgi:hypothetical protein